MNFNQLDEEQKNKLHNQANGSFAKFGGVNFFLQMIEDKKKKTLDALLNKVVLFHFQKVKN